MLKRLPLIVVLGATGTGKSKLAIQLAKQFNGEVISADSMQLYRGLDVVTNKVTDDESEGVPHHCLGFLDPLSSWTVVDFRDKALPIIERLLSEDKLPVIVGGTHYYIESLLWKVLVSDGDAVPNSLIDGPLGSRQKLAVFLEELEFTITTVPGKFQSEDIDFLKNVFGVQNLNEMLEAVKGLSDGMENMCEDEVSKVLERFKSVETIVERLHPDPSRKENRRLHARLKEVDPERAQRLHYNDVRKIKRSLEVFARSQMKHSDFLREQQESEGGSQLGGPLRYPNSAILWITAEQDTLDKRLDDRVDDMLSRGLVKELEEFHAEYNKARTSSSVSQYTQGIFQSIGFKEFHTYLTLADKTIPEAELQMKEGINALKIATRRYARRQVKWIRGRFLRSTDRQVPPVYSLDGTDTSEWNEKVLDPAITIAKSFLGDGNAPEPLPKENVTKNVSLNGERLCRVCMRIFIGDHQWESHIKSKKHHAVVRKKQKLSQE